MAAFPDFWKSQHNAGFWLDGRVSYCTSMRPPYIKEVSIMGSLFTEARVGTMKGTMVSEK